MGRFALRVAALALFGFLAITLAGPILALASLVLCFALVGFVLWLPLHTWVFGENATWRRAVDDGKAIVQRTAAALSGLGQRTLERMRQLQRSLREAANRTGTVLVEALSGSLVAMLLLASIYDFQGVPAPYLVLAATAGAAAGLLVVVSRRRTSESRLPAEGLTGRPSCPTDSTWTSR